ncbi:TPA: hypothetical protein H1809_000782 [Salmonella enterica]|uniref:Bacteriophage protein n=1 Tax=Salmonella enterica TaxID=28901 RepID=A0A748S180_SALER|nr:hypothetical protein [Salmonella enterica]HAK2251406.1 hypothetical protein [Salmonella enterica]HAK6655594.1 hypothetical protein [Salmonella enterica]HAK8882193.1 hypothetical protein [Salmonella enterica]
MALLDELEARDKRIFPVKEDDPRNQVNFLYKPSEKPYCHHASVRVDEKERQVRCKICGAVVEPFDWMLSVAKRETRLADDVKQLRQEERERRKNIEKLIQIERNVKARIRRATKLIPE